MHNAEQDGPNIESPQVWYQEYPSIGNISNPRPAPRRAYHLLYNSGCFADTSYRTDTLTCWLDSSANVTSFTDCAWQSLKNASSESNILLQTVTYPQPNGNPDVVLFAPGGPGVTQDGQYMVFHADINPSWFERKRGKSVAGQPNTMKGYSRKRALFVAELEAGDEGLRIKRLVLPEQA